ncbi:hypothetical protein KZ773_15700 [Escherichia coli]|nr:hypothetical protein [Escherichia coli]
MRCTYPAYTRTKTVGRIRRLRRIRQKAVPNRGPDKAFVRIRHKPCRTLQKIPLEEEK